MDETGLDSILEVQEAVEAPDDFVANAVVAAPAAQRAAGAENSEAQWEAAAGELEWFRSWDAVCEGEAPDFAWFPGAQCNIVHNAIDRPHFVVKRLGLAPEDVEAGTEYLDGNLCTHSGEKVIDAMANRLTDIHDDAGDNG